MPENTPSPQNQKLLGLEAIRFISAFAVLLWHYQHFAVGSALIRERQPFFRLFRVFYDHGAVGVQVFWCLSGFIFFWKYRDVVADRLLGGKKFFLLRFSRLYPLHAATLLLVAALQLAYFRWHGAFFIYRYNDLFHFLLQAFMGSAWGLEHGLSFNGPIWSISLEIVVYFVFYFVLRRMARSMAANLAILAACALAAAAGFRPFIVEAVAFFYLGGLTAILSRELQARPQRSGACAAAWAFLFTSPAAAWVFAAHHWNSCIFFIAYIPPLMFCASQDLAAGRKTREILEAAGNMTYSSYLLHFPVQLVLVLCCSALGRPVPLYSPAFFAVYLLLTLTASYFVYKYFEAPARKFIRLKFA